MAYHTYHCTKINGHKSRLWSPWHHIKWLELVVKFLCVRHRNQPVHQEAAGRWDYSKLQFPWRRSSVGRRKKNKKSIPPTFYWPTNNCFTFPPSVSQPSYNQAELSNTTYILHRSQNNLSYMHLMWLVLTYSACSSNNSHCTDITASALIALCAYKSIYLHCNIPAASQWGFKLFLWY